MTEIRTRPCSACPYRQDVPSGVWAHDEYERLRLWDLPTWEQPGGNFMCHATPDEVCHGWAVVHGDDALGLRLHPCGVIPAPVVPLWASGAEAADHGQADIELPGPAACSTIDRLTAQHARLREKKS